MMVTKPVFATEAFHERSQDGQNSLVGEAERDYGNVAPDSAGYTTEATRPRAAAGEAVPT